MDLDAIRVGLCMHILEGKCTSFMGNAWCTDLPIWYKPIFIMNIIDDFMVNSLFHEGAWNHDMILNLIGKNLRSALCKILIPLIPKMTCGFGERTLMDVH